MYLLGRFRIPKVCHIILVVRLKLAYVGHKLPEKIRNFFRSGKGDTCHGHFLAHLNKGKSLKSLFSPLYIVPMLLEPCSFNINGRKAFRLFLVSSRSDHAFTLNHAPTTPILYNSRIWGRRTSGVPANMGSIITFDSLSIFPDHSDHSLTLDHTLATPQ